jgi:phospholipid-binding lipoprotein MlaA
MRARFSISQLGLALCALVLVLLSGCATHPVGPANPADPLEASNRAVFEFNDAVDRAVLKPVAEAYAFVVPQPVRTCINNIFLNIGDVWSWVNSTLQGRQVDALNTFGRVLLNSTMGLGGCLDIASQTGAKRIPNDFGVTLGVWGLSSGPYVVLPIMGSATLRDGAGRAVDIYVNQFGYRESNTPYCKESCYRERMTTR